jgi:glycogen synthase
VNPDDREELKTAINRLIENDSLRNQYGKKARQRASQFSSDIMVNNYIDLYNNLICKRFPVSESNPINSNLEKKNALCILCPFACF